MKKLIALIASTAALATGSAVVTPQLAGASSCSVTWGSLAKTSTTNLYGTVGGVRSGRHACFDRLVLDNSRSGLGYHVSYVRQVTQPGSGYAVPLRGGAFLQIVDKAHAPRRLAMPNVAGYRTFRQVAWAGSFESQTTIGLGVRARLPFRVFRTSDRLVIDVAHTW